MLSDRLLQTWLLQLQTWAAEGRLRTAAIHALRLNAVKPPKRLNKLVDRLTAKDASSLPAIEVLPNSSMLGANDDDIIDDKWTDQKDHKPNDLFCGGGNDFLVRADNKDILRGNGDNTDAHTDGIHAFDVITTLAASGSSTVASSLARSDNRNKQLKRSISPNKALASSPNTTTNAWKTSEILLNQ